MAKREIFGIVGGMGPLASAEFVKTIYEQSLSGLEQDSPIVLMHSDPSFPDRTESLLAGEYESLLYKLVEVLEELRELGAYRMMICCLTIHYLLPMLPAKLRNRVISLLDVLFEQVSKKRRRHLLISTVGARKLGIYERHARWDSLEEWIILPEEEDQTLIHEGIIYQIKKNRKISELVPILESLLHKYDTDSFIAGCTEIHLLAKHFISGSETGISCIDPLMTIAEDLVDGRLFRKLYEE